MRLHISILIATCRLSNVRWTVLWLICSIRISFTIDIGCRPSSHELRQIIHMQGALCSARYFATSFHDRPSISFRVINNTSSPGENSVRLVPLPFAYAESNMATDGPSFLLRHPTLFLTESAFKAAKMANRYPP
jgi:hypothetical protein